MNDNQNTRVLNSGRSTSRVLAPPGGHTSFSLGLPPPKREAPAPPPVQPALESAASDSVQESHPLPTAEEPLEQQPLAGKPRRFLSGGRESPPTLIPNMRLFSRIWSMTLKWMKLKRSQSSQQLLHLSYFRECPPHLGPCRPTLSHRGPMLTAPML
jgi:hypothetical protein